MAVSLRFCVTKTADCTGFLLTDRTGAYSTLNPTGWGSPNFLLATATGATITIEKRNSDGTYTTSADSPVSVYSTFPSSTGGTYTLTAEDAGYGTDATFADGIYRITYTVTGNSGGAYTYTKTIYYVHKCAIDCCYQTKALEASTDNSLCSTDDKKLTKIAYYYRLLSSAICSANTNLIQKYIDILTSLCEECAGCNDGCGGCGSC